MGMVTACVFIVVVLLCAHFCTIQYQQWRCRKATELQENEHIQLEQDRVSMHVRCDDTISSLLTEGLSFRCEGRIVLTNQRLLLGSSFGRLLEFSVAHPGSIRAMGPRRLLMYGLHPTQKGSLRIELVIDDEQQWENKAIEMGLSPKGNS